MTEFSSFGNYCHREEDGRNPNLCALYTHVWCLVNRSRRAIRSLVGGEQTSSSFTADASLNSKTQFPRASSVLA